jgi:hypothetical protein
MIRHGSDLGIHIFVALIFIRFLVFIFHKYKIFTKWRFLSLHEKDFEQYFDNFIRKPKLIFYGMLSTTAIWRFYLSPIHYKGEFYSLSTVSRDRVKEIWNLEGGYWNNYSFNWACQLDKIKCADLNREISSPTKLEYITEAFKSVLLDPVGYVQLRAPVVWKHWAGDDYPGELNKERLITYFIGVLVLLAILLMFKSLLKLSEIPTVKLLLNSLLLGNMLLLSVWHFESRYFIPIRLFSLMLLFSHYNIDKRLNEVLK